MPTSESVRLILHKTLLLLFNTSMKYITTENGQYGGGGTPNNEPCMPNNEHCTPNTGTDYY